MIKIKKLDLYIFNKFISSFFISIILIIGVVIIFDISEKIQDFVEKDVPLREIIFDYYINFIPHFTNMFSPLFVFITVIFITSKMAANTEIIAILSCGISYKRMLVPYITGAVFISFMSLMLSLFVIPHSNKVRIAFETKYIKTHLNNRTRDVHYQIAPGQFVFVETFSSWSNTAYKFTLEEIKNNQLVSKLSAETAVWDSTKKCWRLNNYFIREYAEAGIEDRVRCGEQLDTVVALTVDDFYRNKYTVETLSLKHLNALIKTQEMRGDTNVMYAQIEKHTRFALPFSALILTIMGVALSSKKKRGGIGWNIAIGIGLSFSYILFLRFSQMFVFTGTLPPYLALWLPNVLFAIVAFILYRIAPK